MTPAELYARWQEIMAEEWRKATDGRQNERAMQRLVDEQVNRYIKICEAVANSFANVDAAAGAWECVEKMQEARSGKPS